MKVSISKSDYSVINLASTEIPGSWLLLFLWFGFSSAKFIAHIQFESILLSFMN